MFYRGEENQYKNNTTTATSIDSIIDKFLSADTIIQAPHDSQSYNRYSYVRNNPLVFTDPSGHSCLSKLWKKVKKYIGTIVAIVVAVVVAIYAPQLLVQFFSSGSWGGVTFSALGTTTIAGTTLTTLGGAVVGAVAGFSAGFFGSLAGGASIGDAVNIGLKAAFAGAITGGIGAHYGNTWNLERVAMHGLGGGTGSEVMGGSFKDGFKLSAALALVTWGAMEMRKYEIASSKREFYIDANGKKVYPNLSGTSSGGVAGDGYKTAGGRVNHGETVRQTVVAPLGGVQGGQGSVFGIPYKPYGVVDYVVESFGGPHDFWRDMLGMYDKYGSSRPIYNWLDSAWDWGNNFAGVVVVSPIVGASIIQQHSYIFDMRDSR